MEQVQDIEPIILPNFCNSESKTKLTSIANADVLQQLLPSLFGTSTVQLEKIDSYMLKETKLWLQSLFGTTPKSTSILYSEPHGFTGISLKQTHCDRRYQESWAWIFSNLAALANSQEHLMYADLYSQNKAVANQRYPHLLVAKHDYLAKIFTQGSKIRLVLCSPVNQFSVTEVACK